VAPAQNVICTLEVTVEFLRSCHRRGPFLFFNGNSFADVGRTLIGLVFAELPTSRRREVMSAVAHYIAGVLDRESMQSIVESLCTSAELKPGDPVKTFMGALRGKVVRLLKDGRVAWRPNGSSSELIALPESLVLDKRVPNLPPALCAAFSDPPLRHYKRTQRG
jgi:hypothetical protein